MSWHDKNQTGDIIQRCTSDVEVIRNFVVTQLLEVFRTIFLVAVSLWDDGCHECEAFHDRPFICASGSCVFGCFLPVDRKAFYGCRRGGGSAVHSGAGECYRRPGCPGLPAEKSEMDRFLEKNNAFANLWIRLGTLSGLYWGVGDLITGLRLLRSLYWELWKQYMEIFPVGEFVAFASYNTALVWPIRGLGRMFL